MLITQPVTLNDIVTLKLITGEELVAKFISEETNTYTVSKPLVFAQTPKGAVLVPFVFTAEKVENISILKSAALAAPFKTQAGVKASYIEFTTGIKTSSGGESIPPLVVS